MKREDADQANVEPLPVAMEGGLLNLQLLLQNWAYSIEGTTSVYNCVLLLDGQFGDNCRCQHDMVSTSRVPQQDLSLRGSS